MKKVMTLTVLIFTSLAFNATAAMDPNIEQTLIKVCKTAMSDNIYKFNKTMMENKINKRRIFPRLVCNGESFHEFAISNGANRIAKKIAPFVKGETSITDLVMNNTSPKVLPVTF
ncbi:DUF3718 domain-containing protein [Shewanella violacea]|uniref:DUF3718 domain-containing protein n=1 Tax=Shewanella violacea (strain JCM 10179 / CIP 106290 / LMG 19151 / DSS12) TaxID=637905 RepID=D4ZHP9_SHEVD|nr:DUF3718 domain-containing protein [Shewanella violacea]BAJ01198.1 hypothetical protein SVI_1227 [Shewanella violacea DSS12]